MSKMVIGMAGKVYGLQRPKAPLVSSVFGDDKEDDATLDPSKAVLTQKHRDKMNKRAEKEMAKALAEDATVFDYDGVLDNIHKEREKEAELVKGARAQREVRYQSNCFVVQWIVECAFLCMLCL
jgi:coiled-coil domain-containing protein 55